MKLDSFFIHKNILNVLGAVILLIALSPTLRAVGNVGINAKDENIDIISGYRLINKLGCRQCHISNVGYLKKSPAADLQKLSSSFSNHYLESFLNGTTDISKYHPVVGGDRYDIENNAKALVSYLSSINTKKESEISQIEIENDNGSLLYESTGCVACHGEKENLTGLSDKYTFDGLRDMLMNPLDYFPTGKMPSQNLTYEEAQALAGYLFNPTSENSKKIYSSNSSEKLRRINQGRLLFEKKQCGSCHNSGGVDRELAKSNLHNLNFENGCLSDASHNGIHYKLSELEKKQIKTALNSSMPLSVSKEIHLTLEDFNCYVCHERNGHGGVTEKLDPFFKTTDPSIGEQGRIPPKLDNVGAKLNPIWLRKVLVQGVRARPYMNTRMPAFGASAMNRLIDLLKKEDQYNSLDKVSYNREMRMSNNGRHLVGSDGMACIACHTFKGKKTGAMGAIDLTIMAQRLNRTWFHEYMMNPQSLSPNTLMPAFWANGNVPKKEVLDGDPFKQIDAIWEYLSEGYGAGNPKGIQWPRIEIKATGEEAVMLRRSYRGIGKRGIGVGFPNGFNVAFSAERLGLALMWTGEFVNAAGVWAGQGHGVANPLSREVYKFPHQPDVLTLPAKEDVWPTPDARPETHAFLGYKLDKWRNPTFRYSINGSVVEDSFMTEKAFNQPDLIHLIEKGKPGLIRRLSVSPKLESPLTFRVASHKIIKKISENSFEMDSKISLRILDGGLGYLVLGDETELRVHVTDALQSKPIVIYYTKLPTQ